MATLKTSVATNWNNHSAATITVKQNNPGVLAKYLNFVDGQQKNRMLWFLIALSVHATVFLPLPIFLVGYFNAPVAVLGITMVSFFANLVANMGGSGIRTTFTFFMASILLHLIMLISVIAF